MNRTTSIIYYIVTTLLAVIAVITFVKLPTIIFVGIEDAALSSLFYVMTVLGIMTFSLYIIDFFLVRLAIYGIMKAENDGLKYRVEQLEQHIKEFKDGIFENKIAIKFIEKKH